MSPKLQPNAKQTKKQEPKELHTTDVKKYSHGHDTENAIDDNNAEEGRMPKPQYDFNVDDMVESNCPTSLLQILRS